MISHLETALHLQLSSMEHTLMAINKYVGANCAGDIRNQIQAFERSIQLLVLKITKVGSAYLLSFMILCKGIFVYSDKFQAKKSS